MLHKVLTSVFRHSKMNILNNSVTVWLPKIYILPPWEVLNLNNPPPRNFYFNFILSLVNFGCQSPRPSEFTMTFHRVGIDIFRKHKSLSEYENCIDAQYFHQNKQWYLFTCFWFYEPFKLSFCFAFLGANVWGKENLEKIVCRSPTGDTLTVADVKTVQPQISTADEARMKQISPKFQVGWLNYKVCPVNGGIQITTTTTD